MSEISGVFLESVSASESGVVDFWCFSRVGIGIGIGCRRFLLFSGVGIGIGIGCRRFLVFFWSRYRHRNRVSEI